MSAIDAGFFFAESENTPMHVGSVTVFEGPAPSYGDIVRLLLSKLPLVPRYRQRVRQVPLQMGRPVWADDPHFQILYHVRHTAVPSPGSDEQLRNLAGRVLGQRLDMAKPLWELWLVEGLADDRWAIISKVHHCMVDGVAGTELMQLMFDLQPDVEHEPPSDDWAPERDPSGLALLRGAVTDAFTHPVQQLSSMPGLTSAKKAAKELADSSRTIASTVPSLAKQAITPTARSLNGPIGPHRRWAWTDGRFEEFKAVRTAFGGTVNDVVLTAITRGFRDLLERRGELSSEKLVVRSMVPVSVRRADQKGKLTNAVSAVFVDLPVGLPDPLDRLASIRGQMDEYKRAMQAVDAPSIIALGDFVAPALLSLGVRAALQAGQMWCQAVTTNVPGPRIPLYVLGKRMTTATAYVPIAGGTRCSIGIFSYLTTMTFGINADFDAFPDVDVLSGGIRAGIEELMELAREKQSQDDVPAPSVRPASATEPITLVTESETSTGGTSEPEPPAGPSSSVGEPEKATPATSSTAVRTAAERTAAKAAPAKKAPPATRASAKKAPAKKASAAKKTTADKTTAKKTTAKKTTARETTAKKATARKTTATKAAAKKTTAVTGS